MIPVDHTGYSSKLWIPLPLCEKNKCIPCGTLQDIIYRIIIYTENNEAPILTNDQQPFIHNSWNIIIES